ncbi:MAG: ComEC/Rec2 family competence protein [Fimbriimonadaceae bacterium]
MSHRTVDEVAFLQVGQGDATLISRNGTNIMVDSGPRSDNFDGGQRFVWPELHKRNIRKLDAVFLTHFDRDHYGGLEAILQRVAVDRVIVVDTIGIDEKNKSILREMGVRSDQLVVLSKAQRIEIGGLSVDVVPGFSGEGVEDNSKSPFLGVNFGADRIILTGDAPREVEEYWNMLGVQGGRIMKAGHHGSDRSMINEWLYGMKPEYVVFSCGRNNPWGHPTLGARARAHDFGAKTLRTDAQGTIRFEPDAQGRLQLVADEDRPAILKFLQR